MSGATPGPWDCTGCMFPDDDMGGVYYRVQADGIVASGANARLIAAAPDLLEALESLMPTFALFERHGMRYDPEQVDAARAAIAKARGEA